MDKNLFEKHSLKTNLIVFCFTLIMIEISLQLFKESTSSIIGDPFKNKIQYTEIHDKFVHHDRGAPNTTKITYPSKRDSFEPVVNYINSFGTRGPEPNFNENPLILFVGDSYIEADEVAFEDTFSEKLNNEFNDRLNFLAHGAGSWGPTTEFSWIFHKGMSLKPETIYLFLCWNDFFPEETYSSGDEAYRSQAVWKNGVPFSYVDPEVKLKLESPIFFRLKQALSQIELVKLVYQGMIKLSYLISPTLTEEEVIFLFSKEAHKWPINLKRNVDQTIEIVLRLNTYLKKKNTNLIMTLVPIPFLWKDEIMAVKLHSEVWKTLIQNLGSEPSKFSLSQRGLDTYLQKKFLQNNIEWLDLTKAFNHKKKNEKQLLYHREDGHWNKFGHEVIFKLLRKKYSEKN